MAHISKYTNPDDMPIIVNVRKLSAWHHDLPDQIRVEKLNEVADDFAYELEQELGGLRCNAHPVESSIITVSADRQRFITLQKRFCCSAFEKKVCMKIPFNYSA